MSESDVLINLTQSLIESITQGNWEAYVDLCDPSLTCFEPEAQGNLVEGMEFHQFYFDSDVRGTVKPHAPKVQTTLACPHVRILGETAIVSYIRITQFVDGDGAPQTRHCEETRVWHRTEGDWKHVHFHRSNPGA